MVASLDTNPRATMKSECPVGIRVREMQVEHRRERLVDVHRHITRCNLARSTGRLVSGVANPVALEPEVDVHLANGTAAAAAPSAFSVVTNVDGAIGACATSSMVRWAACSSCSLAEYPRLRSDIPINSVARTGAIIASSTIDAPLGQRVRSLRPAVMRSASPFCPRPSSLRCIRRCCSGYRYCHRNRPAVKRSLRIWWLPTSFQ